MTNSFARTPGHGRKARVIAAATIILILGGALLIFLEIVNRRVDLERDREAAGSRIEVNERKLRAPAIDGFTVYLDAADARAVAMFDGTRFLATSGGLVAIDDAGDVKRRYSTSDGLPENDLTSLAVFRDRLFVGSSSAGLIAFDGTAFTSYEFVKPKAARVNVLLATESELLIGTDGGLFEYDGNRFSRRVNSASGADFNRVTALLQRDARLYIGTQEKGLYIWKEAHIEHLGTSEGLPSPHVTGLAEMPDAPDAVLSAGSIAVATDFGVIGLTNENSVKAVSSRPNVTSLVVSGGHLWAGLFGGGIIDLSVERSSRQHSSSVAPGDAGQSQTSGLPRSSPAVVQAAEASLWALTREGAFVRGERAAGPGFEPVAASLVRDRLLTGGHITSLALDDSRRLWAGYFDRGLDAISLDSGERLSHIEDDRVREVNSLVFDKRDDRLIAGTSRGVILIDRSSKQSSLTREQSGLISDAVAHVSIGDASMSAGSSGFSGLGARVAPSLVVATAGGMTQIESGRARSLTAFHGLASNHLYSSAIAGSRIFLGSLAGLVEIENLRVVRTYKTSNSRLSNDWVTALTEAEGVLYIGTNGGGVDALFPTGEWVNFADELGKFEVNQNAMHFDGDRIYVGTSDRGLLVYNTRDRRWTRISAGLASPNVTAITSDDRYAYVGTLNGLVRVEKRVL